MCCPTLLIWTFSSNIRGFGEGDGVCQQVKFTLCTHACKVQAKGSNHVHPGSDDRLQGHVQQGLGRHSWTKPHLDELGSGSDVL
jgi:hypothetical protein